MYRLLDLDMQQTYYEEIVLRYDRLQKRSIEQHGLTTQFKDLSISGSKNGTPISSSRNDIDDIPSRPKEEEALLMAMRRLREGIVASKRVDGFAVEVYTFCIRATIVAKHLESYHPALLHLLRVLYPRFHMARSARKEFVVYLILDLACRQGDLGQAFAARSAYRCRDADVDAILDALTHGNYWLFWRVKKRVSRCRAQLMEYGEEGVRTLAVRCLQKTYFTVDEQLVVDWTGLEWRKLSSARQLGWEHDGQRVVLRRQKRA